MTTAIQPAQAEGRGAVSAPSWRRLLRAEIRRATSRRSVWWLSGLTVLALLAISVLIFVNTGPATQADIDQAAASFMTEQQQYYDECMSDPNIPEEERAGMCWKPSPEDAAANAIWRVNPAPFTSQDLESLIMIAGGLACVVALMVGASAGGADWGARTMGLLLSWEPRRLRVFLARLGVLLVLALGLTAIVLGIAWAVASLIASVHGLDPAVQLPPDSYIARADPADGLEIAKRWLPLGVLAAAGGYGVAMAARSTGWAIGATVALLAIVGPILGVVWKWGGQWMVHTNISAWLENGMNWILNDREAYGMDGELTTDTSAVVFITAGRAMGVLVVTVVLLLGIAATLLARRDVD